MASCLLLGTNIGKDQNLMHVFLRQVIRIALALAQSGLGVEVGPSQVKQRGGNNDSIQRGEDYLLDVEFIATSLHWFYRPKKIAWVETTWKCAIAVCWRVTIMAVGSLTVMALFFLLLLLLLFLFFFFFFFPPVPVVLLTVFTLVLLVLLAIVNGSGSPAPTPDSTAAFRACACCSYWPSHRKGWEAGAGYEGDFNISSIFRPLHRVFWQDMSLGIFLNRKWYDKKKGAACSLQKRGAANNNFQRL